MPGRKFGVGEKVGVGSTMGVSVAGNQMVVAVGTGVFSGVGVGSGVAGCSLHAERMRLNRINKAGLCILSGYYKLGGVGRWDSNEMAAG